MFDPKKMVYFCHKEAPNEGNTGPAALDITFAERGIILSAPQKVTAQLSSYGMTRQEAAQMLRVCADEIDGRLVEQPRMDRHS